jgi:hypothetical protein
MGLPGTVDGTGEDLLRPETWATLVDAILAGECTPFLGAGVCVPYLPTGGRLALELAEGYGYPLEDVTNLARVTQYIASMRDTASAKRIVCERIRRAMEETDKQLGGTLPNNHIMLARLGLPMYVTTNYDDYLQRALGSRPRIRPETEICRWNDRLTEELPQYLSNEPTASEPRIFHLHGYLEKPNSIVVTEDDYIDFTVSLARRTDKRNPVLSHFVRRALGNTNLLYIGYSLEDWNFRVLMRHLITQQRVLPHSMHSSVSIQLSNDRIPVEQRRRAEGFLEKYLKVSSSIEVFWGDAGEFLEALLRQLDRAREGSKAS